MTRRSDEDKSTGAVVTAAAAAVERSIVIAGDLSFENGNGKARSKGDD